MSSGLTQNPFFNNFNTAFQSQRELPQNANGISNKRRSGPGQYRPNKNFAKRNYNGQMGNVNMAHAVNKVLGVSGRQYHSNMEAGFRRPKPAFSSTQSGARNNFAETYSRGNAGRPFQNGKYFDNSRKIDRRTKKIANNLEPLQKHEEWQEQVSDQFEAPQGEEIVPEEDNDIISTPTNQETSLELPEIVTEEKDTDAIKTPTRQGTLQLTREEDYESRQKTSPTDASIIRGTCMDMCPEKERYERERSGTLSYFEIIPETNQQGRFPSVDHSKAVKEYCRSSADQPLPLPSELRPPQVLKMTMNYLLANVVNKGCPCLWSEWYTFIWNRMRAIRKDITHQMLCDMTAVELVEKCARFHIICSELLCEEEADVFDQKINSENLTKCLQTLKELYNDLFANQGVTSPNEAEFRSYMILMNINEAGNILVEAHRWRKDILHSNAVKNSMQIYYSVSSNNYIRFFRLVRESRYLESCILHRYFNQVRSAAVERLSKAYKHLKSTCLTEVFADQLGFDSSAEAEAFMRQCGLIVADGDILNKNDIVKEQDAKPKRSMKLVGSKINRPLGEIANGGPLILEEIPTSKTSSKEPAINGNRTTTTVDMPIQQILPKPNFSSASPSVVRDCKIMEVDEDIPIPTKLRTRCAAYRQTPAIRTIESKPNAQIEECDKDYSKKSSDEFVSLMQELSNLSSSLKIIDEPEQAPLTHNQDSEKIHTTTEKHQIDISNEPEVTLPTEVSEYPTTENEVINDEIKNEKKEKKESLYEFISNEVRRRIEMEVTERTKFCWSPLNVCQMIKEQIDINGGVPNGKRTFWKLVISLPPEGSILNSGHNRFTKWLARKFKLAEECLPEDETELCIGHTQRVATSTGLGYGSVDMCIRSTRGTSFHALTMQGASSILFYIRDQSETCNLHQLLEMESERLSAFLGNRPSLPAPTLTIIGSKNQNWTTDYVSQSLRLSSYVEKELIDSFNVVMCDDIWQKETSHQLKDCVSFMIQRLPPSPPLRTQPVIEFFETYLSKFFSNPVINNLQRRQYNRTKDHDLPILINMYNEVASWLIRKVTDISDLGSISWPPSELCFTDNELPPPMWNLEERLEALESYLEDIILLPQFPVTNDVTFDEACQTLNNYIKVIAEHSPSAWKLASNVNNILERAKPQLKSRKRARFAKISPQLSSSIIPWTSIVLALVEFQLSNLYGLKDLNFERLLTVSYFEDLIRDAPKLVFPPLEKSSEDVESSSTCISSTQSSPLHSEHEIPCPEHLTKEDIEALFDKVKAEKEANELFLKYLEEALDCAEDFFNIESKSKKARLY